MTHSLFRLILTGLFFALLTTPPAALAAPNCDDPKHADKPACSDDNGGAGTYTVKLTMGGFIFDAGSKKVTPNARNNALSSTDGASMTRPTLTGFDQDTWNLMFATCGVLLEGMIESFSVNYDQWSIQKAGSDDIRIIFDDIRLQQAEVTVQIIAHPMEGVPLAPFLPESGTSVFAMHKGAIYGNSVKGSPGPRRGCQSSGGGGFDVFTLGTPSVLEITRDKE